MLSKEKMAWDTKKKFKRLKETSPPKGVVTIPVFK
jgi:hypothetical protein